MQYHTDILWSFDTPIHANRFEIGWHWIEWLVFLLPPLCYCARSKSHRSRKKAKERREEEDRITARERALQDEVRCTYNTAVTIVKSVFC